MGGVTMKVRIKQSFHSYRAGQEFDWPRPMSKILAARGLIEIVEDEAADEVETAEMPERAVERAVAPRKPRRRKA